MFRALGLRVKLVEKHHEYLQELLRKCQTDQASAPTELLKTGNCILLAVSRLVEHSANSLNALAADKPLHDRQAPPPLHRCITHTLCIGQMPSTRTRLPHQFRRPLHIAHHGGRLPALLCRRCGKWCGVCLRRQPVLCTKHHCIPGYVHHVRRQVVARDIHTNRW